MQAVDSSILWYLIRMFTHTVAISEENWFCTLTIQLWHYLVPMVQVIFYMSRKAVEYM